MSGAGDGPLGRSHYQIMFADTAMNEEYIKIGPNGWIDGQRIYLLRRD